MKPEAYVEIAVDEATAELLKSSAHRELMGELVIRMAKPWDGDDPLSGMLHGELMLRQAASRAVIGLSTGQVALMTRQPIMHMSTEELRAPWPAAVVLADIVAWAGRVLKSDAAVKRWLFSRNMALGGQRPIELLATNEGTLRTVTLLGQIQHGVYS
jgi:hypothetical protein